MTEPTKSVDVAQCDRDAARAFLGDVVYRVSSSGQKLAEAFARHRLEATRTPPGESGLREALKILNEAIDKARDMIPDEEEGLAASVFACYLNAAQMKAKAALSST